MSKENTASDITLRVVADPTLIDPHQWNELVDLQPSATPFMRHEYLAALHASGSAVADAGWSSQFLLLEDKESAGRLLAACPLYLKSHSYGEYVFDWAWADAYRRHGLDYYPKLLDAVPFTPVPGPRLLARDAQGRRVLLGAMEHFAEQEGLSSAHVLFLDEEDRVAAQDAGWMMRSTVQFHWTNSAVEPFRDFPSFLATLQREKRKKIQQERRKVAEAGVDFVALQGHEIGNEEWDFFYRCYTLTYRAHHSTPYLTRDFFRRMATSMAEYWVMFIGRQQGERIAASLVCIDPQRRAAFGRYWGSTRQVSCMHFEACYYQPLQWCIEHGYQRFEGGAQGEHKMARGLMPVQTWSAHWLAHPQFAAAVSDFLAREGQAMAGYIDELNEHGPFKAPT